MGPGAVVEPACLESRRSRIRTPLRPSSFEETLRSFVMIQYCGEVACSASDRQGSNFESSFWRAVSSHQRKEILLTQFSLYVA